MNLGTLRSPELSGRAPVLAVPLGATEQHGPHLPLDTDTTIATELSRQLAKRVPGIVVAPPIPYGSSGEHADFDGTLSIGQHALRTVLIELVRSADRFTGTVLVNGHGGNHHPLTDAVRQLRTEGRQVLAWSPTGPADDSHAGHTETSVMLHLRPHHVALDRAVPGATAPLPELINRLRTDGVKAISPNGILGDPTRATAAVGELAIERWTADLTHAVSTWLAHPPAG
ncbi:mycofactocin biosynthesis peptidyl-dipeptidase MftE [Haloechinothrix salitolerans]|uniref:Mycofactocin biosynthesis peptidyl-dipeptidase MftE n=1 Tax=Haloechinothrix salitolerans TaxID=926830 RepID=A0ABW2C2A4_9PSEU